MESWGPSERVAGLRKVEVSVGHFVWEEVDGVHYSVDGGEDGEDCFAYGGCHVGRLEFFWVVM